MYKRHPGVYLLSIFLITFIFSTTAIAQSLEEAVRLNEEVVNLYQQGRYKEAIPIAKRALEIRERHLGKDHPDVATSLNNLAELYRATRRFAEAEPLYKRALVIREKQLGKNGLSIATTLKGLAMLYQATYRDAAAVPLYERALEIKGLLFSNDPDTEIILYNLAALYRAAGRYAKAELLTKRALEISSERLGIPYPVEDKATSAKMNFSSLINYDVSISNNKCEDSRSPANIWLKLIEQRYGKDHPKIVASLNDLADCYKSRAEYIEVESLYKRALMIRERGLGKDHPDTVISLNNLAELYRTTGRYKEAEPLYKRALKIRERKLGKDHPDIVLSLYSLASLYYATGRSEEAEPLYQRALKIEERQLGKDHPPETPDHASVHLPSSSQSISFSKDWSYFASGGKDNTVTLLDVKKPTNTKTLKGHFDAVFSVTFSTDGKLLASGSADSTIVIWDVATGHEIRVLTGHSKDVRTVFRSDGTVDSVGCFVHAVVFSPDGRLLASGGLDKTVILWDVDTWSKTKIFTEHSEAVNTLAFSPDGRILASGGGDMRDMTIFLWDINRGIKIKELRGHTQPVNVLAFSPDGKTLASGSSDKTIVLWDVDSGNKIMTFSGHSSYISSVVFSPDGKLIASGSADSTIILWDVMTGRQIATLPVPSKADPLVIKVAGQTVLKGYSTHLFVAVSPDGKTLASVSDDTLRYWDICKYVPCH